MDRFLVDYFNHPKVEYFSIIAAFKPNCEALTAAIYPPGPDPITIKSYFIFIEFNEIQK